jgi:selenocysteine-specific elongation factor
VTVVIGTAGHIDHGKTTLLRALTGIDADRLPEEQRRGMTIDVGYAHLTLPDGTELDFVDVPGHDRLVGNMLVGAGEVDAAMLVVAADDGPRAQTLEHLALLDALGIGHGVAVVTKADVGGPERTAEVVAAIELLLSGTTLAGSPVLAVSSVDGDGVDALRTALMGLRDRVLEAGANAADRPSGSRLAIDRVFSVKGRGAVVTGTLRGRPLSRGATLRLVPGDRSVRVREVQVHGVAVDEAEPGRTALNIAGIESGDLHRGLVVTNDYAVVASDRMLVRLDAAPPDRARARAHLGTAAVDASIGRSGRDALDLLDGAPAAIIRLAAPIAAASGDRLVLRRTSGADRIVGAQVIDVAPPRGISRRRQTAERVGRLAAAVADGGGQALDDARLDLHGILEHPVGDVGRTRVASDLVATIDAAVLTAVTVGGAVVAPLADVRETAARTVRRQATISRSAATTVASNLIDRLVADGQLDRRGSWLALPGTERNASPPDQPLLDAMERLERSLAVVAPPPLTEAAAAAACPTEGVRELERSGRIVVLDGDLAYATATYDEIAGTALRLAATAPLTPAGLRDATGTSRKYVMAILEDLDRRGILRRTPNGHVPGPRATRSAVTAP